ncbi:NAD(P)-dependent oxidoreductase [Silvimonas soli]|uniref:NAD(P)-dependent oxidoreductase n=1 Tax=Silvimonas soli TaxID=2980100 RepID=UPI0024B35957|nr:NAD(P)-dependent oxidoreductase [Silvimonas soli]
MNIVLIGATGFIGSALLSEALARGHKVTAIVQHPEKLPAHASLTGAAVNVLDTGTLTQTLEGHDAVLSAFSGHAQTDVRDYYVAGFKSILTATKASALQRLLVVGGAGSLEVAPGLQVVDTPEFPEQWRGTALGARDALDLLRSETSLDWTMLSPSAYIHPGERTGVFRLGGDQLLVDSAGKSEISVQDYAVALIDELEQHQHSKQRFTVGY